ncbi:helix-turn-helix transcriptional regulator [Natrialbaceae archaeon A-CW3]
MKNSFEAETDELIQVLRHRHVFAELQKEALERRQLEDRLGVSRATSHRYVRALEDLGLLEKTGGRYVLTDLGADIAATVATFETEVSARLRLAPMVDVMGDVTPQVDIAAFEDATVTSIEYGDPFAPLTRFISLVQETETLRGINTCRIAPTYMDEFQERILDGMQTELIDLPRILEDIMERYPEKCVQVCVSENLGLWIHENRGSLPFGLVLFDDRIGIGLFDTAKGTVEAFIDTDEPAAIEWGTAVYAQYQLESSQLENFTKKGLQNAIAQC